MQLQNSSRRFLAVKVVIVTLFLSISFYSNSQDVSFYPCRTACNIGILIGEYRSGDSIKIAALLKSNGIQPEAGSFTILSYRIIMDGAGFSCELFEIYNAGEKFTDKTLSVFRKLRPGNFMSIDCITAKDANGFITGLKPAVYLIR